jgi:hypothetical protein
METITFEDIKQMFRETDKKFQDTAIKMQETDREIDRVTKLVENLTQNLSGISDNNGAYAENFFYTALENSMQIGSLKFDYIDRNIKRKRNNTEGQFDIILYNSYKVVIVEVKYSFTTKQLREFYEKRLKKFRILYPEYANYKVYGCIAAMTIDDNTIKEAEEYGFYILTQNNQDIKILNDQSFEPNPIK